MAPCGRLSFPVVVHRVVAAVVGPDDVDEDPFRGCVFTRRDL